MMLATLMLWMAASVPQTCIVSATGVADAFYSGRKEVCGKPLTRGESWISHTNALDYFESTFILHVEERAYELRVRDGFDGAQNVDEISIKLQHSEGDGK